MGIVRWAGLTPTTSWSWNMEGEPVGDHWYETQRSDHEPAPENTPH